MRLWYYLRLSKLWSNDYNFGAYYSIYIQICQFFRIFGWNCCKLFRISVWYKIFVNYSGYPAWYRIMLSIIPYIRSDTRFCCQLFRISGQIQDFVVNFSGLSTDFDNNCINLVTDCLQSPLTLGVSSQRSSSCRVHHSIIIIIKKKCSSKSM